MASSSSDSSVIADDVAETTEPAPPLGTPELSLGEGETPLVALAGIGRLLGVEVWGKLELCNPTGSYKDRVAARSLAAAVAAANDGWIATSSGNAGTALAAYGARASLPGLLLVQSSSTREKLIPCLALGAEVLRVTGVGSGGTPGADSRMFDLVRHAARRLNLFLGITAHAYNPEGMRGAEAIGVEIGRSGRWDAVYVPTGGGGLITAVARGLEASTRSPVVAVQPSGSAPIVRCLNGELATPRLETCETRVTGLQLAQPPDGDLAVETTRRLNGWGAHVSDDSIFSALQLLARKEGVFAEPAAAAALAGVIADLQAGRLKPGARVACVLTGSGLKDIDAAESVTAGPSTVALDDLNSAIASWADARSS